MRLSRMMKRKKPEPQAKSDNKFSIAWFEEDQYRRLLEVADDRADLFDTYPEWVKAAQALIAKLPARPLLVKFKVDELLAWCQEQKISLNGDARTRYATQCAMQLERAGQPRSPTLPSF